MPEKNLGESLEFQPQTGGWWVGIFTERSAKLLGFHLVFGYCSSANSPLLGATAGAPAPTSPLLGATGRPALPAVRYITITTAAVCCTPRRLPASSRALVGRAR